MAILRLICEEILREAKRQPYFERWSRAMTLTQNLANDLRPQIFRATTPGWRDRDDKWAFPRSVLDKIAQENGAELRLWDCTTMSGNSGVILPTCWKPIAG